MPRVVSETSYNCEGCGLALHETGNIKKVEVRGKPSRKWNGKAVFSRKAIWELSPVYMPMYIKLIFTLDTSHMANSQTLAYSCMCNWSVERLLS